MLAAEPRLILPRDVDCLRCDYTSLRVVYLDTPWYKDQQVLLKAPCLLPELHLVKEVRASIFLTLYFDLLKFSILANMTTEFLGAR